jgi:preprotein translocase subunit SecE
VLVAVAIAAVYTSVLDFGFSRVVDLVVNFLT